MNRGTTNHETRRLDSDKALATRFRLAAPRSATREIEMMVPKLLFAACLFLPGQSAQNDGTIRGVVLNASRGDVPAGGAEVVLRVKLDGQFVPLAETAADAQGRFDFEELPLGEHFQYLPGANRDGIHYPGPRVQLTRQRPRIHLELSVCDSVAEPNPLVIRRHEILVRPEPGALHVTETLLIANPTSICYVGRAVGQDTQPVTLRLNVPSDFDRATFHKEFFGRRFSLAAGKLVTGIPWTPGERELKLTYVLPNTQAHRLWQRPLDLPCSDVRVCVETTRPDEVICNLPAGPVRRRGETTLVTFASDGKTLPAGHVIRLELGRLPVPWMAYGSSLAVAALALLIAGASVLMIRRRRTPR